jgi:hypothetical protein
MRSRLQLRLGISTTAKVARRMPSCAALLLVVVGLSSCGGSSSDGPIPGNAVAQVGNTSITRAEVNHWMATLAGGEFNELSKGRVIPAGLVAEPANYAMCVSHLENAISEAKTKKLTAEQLLSKCRELYRALKLQATAYLINAQWMIDVAADVGVKASADEVMQALKQYEAHTYPKAGEFQRYLEHTRRSLADELLVIKQDILAQKIAPKLESGGAQMVKSLTEVEQRWSLKTDCRPGYVVTHCKQYTKDPTPPARVPPSVLVEQLATILGTRCVNREACG